MAKPVFLSSIIYPKFGKSLKSFKTSDKSLDSISIQTFCRNSIILPIMLGKTFNVHNGRTFLRVLVSENIVGHKLGEFSQSRRRYYFKKGKKGKQKGKK
jgi:small subunit ribosomal protein S19